MSSRGLQDLHKLLMPLATNHMRLCEARGVALLIYCTYRSNAEQSALYAIGRTQPGKIVTNARAGESDHNSVDAAGRPAARAYDCVPLMHGKPVWGSNDPIWALVGACGEEVGLVWSGRWKRFKETAHFALPKEEK